MTPRTIAVALACGCVLGWTLGLLGAYISLCVLGPADWPDGKL